MNLSDDCGWRTDLAQAAIESFAQHSSQDVMGHRVYERRVEQGPEGNTCVAAPCARRQPGFDLTTPCPESTARPPQMTQIDNTAPR